MNLNKAHIIVLAICLIGISNSAFAQSDSSDKYSSVYSGLSFRNIGPERGGRSAAVTGVPGNPMLYYMGTAGGGVWKSDDGGNSWGNISDGFFGGSIGAVSVAPSNPNVIYVGGGEKTVRGNVSHGYGIWKTTDGGANWKHLGLEETRRIPRIRIDPKNPDKIYVAALGHLHGPNSERGIYKSTDGGETFKKVLFVNDEVGAFDLVIDPNNSDVLYASTWRIKRTPYSLESGGDGSGLWKSTDAGETWTNITGNRGLPKSTIGVIGVTVSPVDSNRVWAIIESADGGVFRSDNGGETWTKTNSDRSLRQRAWYYTRIYAGPKNKDEVYVLNVRFVRSGDGGKTFSSISTPHSDHHDLWIDPSDPNRMIIGDDGGGQVSFNRGRTWSTYQNQPTAQFYRVTTDNHFPYRIYGAQQDNSTVRIASRSNSFSISESDWESTAGGESGHIAPDPNNNDIVYGGSYGGYLTRYDHKTKSSRNIHVWPDNPMGHGAGDNKYRFQWNFPIFFSRHDSKTLFTAAQVLFKTTNEGQTWTRISPDLTRNDKSKLGSSGGPITKDNTSVEYYCTIFAAAESIHEKDVIWVGTDDGLVQLTRDGGKKWENVTPEGLPEWAQINSIEPDPFEKGGLYIAATRYKSDDFKPYLFHTVDFGKTWKRIDKGIGRKHFTRVIRADAKRKGLLYAGTETGLYVSFNNGSSWQSLQLNLPIVPITDLAIKNDDLIVATQGRAFWVLDDLTILRQLNSDNFQRNLHVYNLEPVLRMRGGRGRSSSVGANPIGGAAIYFNVKEMGDEKVLSTVEIMDSDQKLIKKYSTKPGKGESTFSVKEGLNQFVWDMRYPSAKTFSGMILWGGGTSGPMAVPGKYQAKITVGKVSQTVDFEIVPDPRATATAADYAAQFDFLVGVRDKLSETHESISQIRKIRTEIKSVVGKAKSNEAFKDVVKLGNEIVAKLTKIEETLYQTKNQSRQDPLNFPIRLNNRLSSLGSSVATGNFRPTDQAIEVRKVLEAEIDVELAKLKALIKTDVAKLNGLISTKKVPFITVD